jgi:hypothetical protein
MAKSIFALSLQLKLLFFEEFIFVFGNVFKKNITVGEQDLVLIGQVTCHVRQQVFVHYHNSVQCTLSDLQRRQVRQKIVANKEAQEDEVIN